jgi:y4mF family transcriptional regulator
MRIATARDLGLVVRQSREDRGQTQAQLATEAGVSRRWLSDLEAGKATAEVGLVLRTLHALGLGLNTYPMEPGADGIDLDALFDTPGGDRA